MIQVETTAVSGNAEFIALSLCRSRPRLQPASYRSHEEEQELGQLPD